MTSLSLLPPSHLYFESYLEMAALKRQVVSYKVSPEGETLNMFVEKVRYAGNEVSILTTDGTIIPKNSLAGILVDADPGDLEAISCLCQ